MSQYIDKKEAQRSYRPVAGSMSPGLKRAREPYRVKNAIVGLGLGAFAVGVWAYSISAVKQDVFDDVDEEAQELAAPPAGVVPALPKSTPAPVSPPPAPATGEKQAPAIPSLNPVPKDVPSVQARGVLQHLPWLLDPAGKTLVWGAPPVDNVGKLSRS